jgi:predicted acylesterase/phospholipase RssA
MRYTNTIKPWMVDLLMTIYKKGLLLTIILLQGCARITATPTLPEQLENQAYVPGYPNVRGWADVYNKDLQNSAIASIKQEKAAHHGKLTPYADVLALSGGGEDGAFGAGVLCGWTKSGKRPEFKLVTGISTGALMGSFAFLGPAYDGKLREAYTQVSDKNIYKAHSIVKVLLSLANLLTLPSFADNQPLADLIAKLIDEPVLKKIAAEHRKGRRFLVGTTQLDAERLVIWDMGAIANSGNPHALEMFRKILLASASLPATFPPQYFTVVANGKKYQEMHVDGGVEAQVMIFENALIPFSIGGKYLQGHSRTRRLYIIRNQRIDPEWDNVKPQLKSIAIRSIGSLTKSQGIGDLYRLYVYAQRDKMEYNLAYIPDDFKVASTSEFDKTYMQKLFARGYKMGDSGYPWKKSPPDYDPNPHENKIS